VLIDVYGAHERDEIDNARWCNAAGQPASIRLHEYPNTGTVMTSKNFFRAQVYTCASWCIASTRHQVLEWSQYSHALVMNRSLWLSLSLSHLHLIGNSELHCTGTRMARLCWS